MCSEITVNSLGNPCSDRGFILLHNPRSWGTAAFIVVAEIDRLYMRRGM